MHCVSTLLTSHGETTVIFFSVELLIFLSCLIVSCLFTYKLFINKQRKHTMANQSKPQKKPNWNIANHQIDKCLRWNTNDCFLFQYITIPLDLSLTWAAFILHYIIELHFEVKVHIDIHSYTENEWTDYVESKCHFSLEKTKSILSMIFSILFLFGYCGILSIYLTRLIVIFENSVFAISRKSKILFYTIFFLIIMINTSLILTRFIYYQYQIRMAITINMHIKLKQLVPSYLQQLLQYHLYFL